MSDLELLKHAAQAAGISGDWTETIGGWPALAVNGSVYKVWQPLHDDGDALALAVKLDMSVEISEYEASTYAYAGPMSQPIRVHGYEMWRGDKAAATRRAIVKAAAAVAALPITSQGTSPTTPERN